MTTIDDYIEELADAAPGEADRVNARGLRRPMSGVSFTFAQIGGAALGMLPNCPITAMRVKYGVMNEQISFHVRLFELDADLVTAHVREHGPEVTLTRLRTGEFAPTKGE